MTSIPLNNQVNFAGVPEKKNKALIASPLADAAIIGTASGLGSLVMDCYEKGKLTNISADLTKKPSIKENISKAVELIKNKGIEFKPLLKKAGIALVAGAVTTYILDKVINAVSNKIKDSKEQKYNAPPIGHQE